MLYVPRVEDKNSHMRMLRISNIEDLVANSMDILEPSPVDADQNEREDGKLSNNKGFSSSHFMVILLSVHHELLNCKLQFNFCTLYYHKLDVCVLF